MTDSPIPVSELTEAFKRIDERLWATHGSHHPEALIACLKEIEEIVKPFLSRSITAEPGE